jgi:hypothetical protein
MKNEINLVPAKCDPDITQIVELRKKSDEIKKELEKRKNDIYELEDIKDT